MTEGEFAPFIEGLIAAKEADERELKPCPFCGSPAKGSIRYSDHPCAPYTFYSVKCTQCPAMMETGTSRADVIDGWNRRVKE